MNRGIRTGTVSCLSASPRDPNSVYTEIAENAVFRSASGGDSWERCPDFLSCGFICAIGIAPARDHDVLYTLVGKG